jgi:hypothetical protein
MPDDNRLIEQRWVEVKSHVMDKRLDTLRRMADYRASKIEKAVIGSRRYDSEEHAALMWAIAELSGIGDEVRKERLAMHNEKLGTIRKALKRAEIAEALNIQFRVKVDALKAEIHRLRTASDENPLH